MRYGLRLIDLMMTILVVALVAMFLAPWLQTSQCTGGRRTQCQNNMRQIALGLLGHVNAHNALPNAATIFDDESVHHGDPNRSNLYRALTDPHSFQTSTNYLRRNWVVDILPYIDGQELFNTWNFQESSISFHSLANTSSNFRTSSTSIDILRCPDDDTAVANDGNLSYVVNGGFMRWPAVPVSWAGSSLNGQSQNGPLLRWAPSGTDWRETQAIGKKMGALFLGTHSGGQPWDITTAPKDITDGANTTLLIAENRLVGVSRGTVYSGGLPTNWACPLPNFVMFLGSDNICESSRSATNCLAGQLAHRSPGRDAPGWAAANNVGTYENINFGQAFGVEGSFPFANSGHQGGCNFAFCDGTIRFLSETIDGSVYSKLITPAGEVLPPEFKQQPITQNSFE